MSTPRTLGREAIARTVVEFAATTGRPLFVGNGYLAREAAHLTSDDAVFCLVGGMGLAPAVAAGYSFATGRSAVVLEGDGNHLMGLPATAFNGLHAVQVIHVVHWNGGWESTGGTAFGPAGGVCDIGASVGYGFTTTVADAAALRHALGVAGAGVLPALVHVEGAMGDAVRARVPVDMAASARRFRSWVAREGERS